LSGLSTPGVLDPRESFQHIGQQTSQGRATEAVVELGPSSTMRNCRCHHQYESVAEWKPFYQIRNASIGLRRTRPDAKHHSSCPYYLGGATKISLETNLRWRYTSTMDYLLRFSLTLLTGGAGFSISPSLTLKGMVRNSPVESVIRQMFCCTIDNYIKAHPVEYYLDRIDWGERRLWELYQSREASPYEQEAKFGETHLHVCGIYLYGDSRLGCSAIEQTMAFG